MIVLIMPGENDTEDAEELRKEVEAKYPDADVDVQPCGDVDEDPTIWDEDPDNLFVGLLAYGANPSSSAINEESRERFSKVAQELGGVDYQIIFDDFGFPMIFAPYHPMGNEEGFVHLHRINLETNIREENPDHPALVHVEGHPKPYLHPNAVVFHKDGNKMNFSKDNLEVVSLGDGMATKNQPTPFLKMNNDGEFVDIREYTESFARVSGGEQGGGYTQ